VEDFKPDDTGISPLARVESWYRTPCPRCGGAARRETDVSDTFLDSAWYFLRYPSARDDDAPFDPELTRRWLPVHSYIGGNEHAVLHLLYSRFVTMVLRDAGYIHFEEPFTRFRAHGMIVRDGAKMSKSRGNVGERSSPVFDRELGVAHDVGSQYCSESACHCVSFKCRLMTNSQTMVLVATSDGSFWAHPRHSCCQFPDFEESKISSSPVRVQRPDPTAGSGVTRLAKSS
jgi:hypothetical protein